MDLFGNTNESLRLTEKAQKKDIKNLNKKKDWTGDKNSVFRTLASSHHTEEEREVNDYYATDPAAAEMLLELETFAHYILEPSCGEGHLARVFTEKGYDVKATDLIDRGYGEIQDFFDIKQFTGDIITNPPYSLAKEFIQHSLAIIPDSNKVAMFLKVQFMEGKGRKQMFLDHPPKTIWVSSSRINCAKNGDFTALRKSGGSAVAYAWYVWEKGFKGTTSLKWFN